MPAQAREFSAKPTIALRLSSALLCSAVMCIAGLVQGAPEAAAEDASNLTIATWGGAYAQSQQIAYFEPFTQQTGTKIETATYDGTLAAIKAKIQGGTSSFDLVDVSPASLSALCHDGLVEEIDPSLLHPTPDGASATDDFLTGGLPPCGVASVAWSALIAFDRQAFGKSQPSKISQLLDVQHFPGKRALPNGPRYTLELMLLADGVAPADVYSTLATSAGSDRAFAALDKIKNDILWWDKPQDAISWLIGKKASMAAGYSGRIFPALVANRQRLDVLWDGQIYDLDLWAIPKGAGNEDQAKRFITFASDPARQAAQARLIAYGPMRKSAIPLVGKQPEIDVEMKNFLPTAPDNFKNALKFDEVWWNEHGDELAKRFQAWREQASTAEAPATQGPGQAQ